MTPRYCAICHQPMKSYKGQLAGVHPTCKTPRPARPRGRCQWKDDTPEEIEAKFQAALRSIRQAGMQADALIWPSSLKRTIR